MTNRYVGCDIYYRRFLEENKMTLENRFCVTLKCEYCSEAYHLWIEYGDAFSYENGRHACPHCGAHTGLVLVKAEKPVKIIGPREIEK